MRDRLKELRSSASASTNPFDDVETGFVPEETVEMRQFFEQVNEIRSLTDAIANNTKELESLYNLNLNEPQESVKKQRTGRIDKLVNDTNKTAITIRKKLQAMEAANHEKASKDTSSTSADTRARTSQHSTLTKRFVDVMGTYQELQSQNKRELRKRQERELRIVQKDATDEEIQEALDNISGPIFGQQIEMASQKEEAKRMLENIQSRHEDILKLEESLKELRQLFLDMQALVESQGEMLNEIENAVDQAVDYTEKGVKEMTQAVKFQKSARKKQFILLGCVCCLLVVIIVPIAAVFASKQHP